VASDEEMYVFAPPQAAKGSYTRDVVTLDAEPVATCSHTISRTAVEKDDDDCIELSCEMDIDTIKIIYI